MFGEKVPSSEFINRSEYRDKVLGCWTGKNIGGTLGAPMEGRREIFDVKFYVQDLKGKPAPNDDLDLQLIWLLAVEENGIYQVNERVLGEYWLSHITGPWNEYGVGKVNMANGLVPPLSGAFNNEQWKNSNGAWIRSEIWACLFPGAPDDALEFAWCDACVDHADDGIYAELFTTALESAAFVESDIRKLIDIALAKIPADCRVARSVGIAIREYEAGHDFKTARNAVVEDSADLGWFQAPANVAFAVIGLLYGEGDFGRSLCFAVNCGDDTDCTGATVGAVLGIVKGRAGIPAEWIEPIGETIRTVAIDPFHAEAPADLDELTERVIRCAEETQTVNPTLPRLTDGPTTISEKLRASLLSGEQVERRLWHKSSFAFRTALPFGVVEVEYLDGLEAVPGETKKLRLSLRNPHIENKICYFDWNLPEGWLVKQGEQQSVGIRYGAISSIDVELTVGEFDGAYVYLPLSVRLSGRNYPTFVTIPFQFRGSVRTTLAKTDSLYWDNHDRMLARRAR